ncbi:hypothetical protein A7X84_02740 [Stenotrophomonas maltophilia]|uniref:hypothetical protein n=1 Tax=Stenotrophomonas maltophilia TaxID=40324 RepID=UPI000DA883B7|nr:hypothetical protein [Stenotrophomonas maltophilia]PZS77582.1 hypothetical protein A7X84_02740 [Stenotrophomonas maltophilia]PZT14495.1 hypothetical protein A7X82_01940 [Stenotrophomonas maltophilia]
MQDQVVEMIGWMRQRKLEYGEPVLVQHAIDALNLGRLDRSTASGVLEKLKSEGILRDAGGRFAITKAGFNRIYPETDAQCIENVMEDIVRYMAERSPASGFQLAEYSTVMRRRLNPKEVAFIGSATDQLENEGFWKASGRGSYLLTQAGADRVAQI